jgi:hypothetical protein
MMRRKVCYLFAAVVLISVGLALFQRHSDFSSVKSWFTGAADNRLTALELNIQGSRIMVTNTNLINEFDIAIKRAQATTGPIGRRCSARAQIDGRWRGELEISCDPNSSAVVIGIPTVMPPFYSDFSYLELKVASASVRIFFQAIDTAYRLKE